MGAGLLVWPGCQVELPSRMQKDACATVRNTQVGMRTVLGCVVAEEKRVAVILRKPLWKWWQKKKAKANYSSHDVFHLSQDQV